MTCYDPEWRSFQFYARNPSRTRYEDDKQITFQKEERDKDTFQSSELANAQINKKSTYRKLQLINPGLIELRKGFRWTYIGMNKGVSF